MSAGESAWDEAKEEGEDLGTDPGEDLAGLDRQGKGCRGSSRRQSGLESGRCHPNERGQPHGVLVARPEELLQL